MPSTVRPFDCWKARTAAAVIGPKMPSTTTSPWPCWRSRYWRDRMGSTARGPGACCPCLRSGQSKAMSYLPGGAGSEQVGQLAGTASLAGGQDLAVDQRAGVGALDGPEHADGRRLERPSGEVREQERQARVGAPLVVHQDGVLAHVGHAHDLGVAVPVHDHAPLPVGPEPHRLAVHERDQHVLAGLAGGDLLEGAVVEDVAVLVDLDEAGTPVVVGPPERLHHVGAVEVVGAGYERRLGAEGQADGVEGMVYRTERGGLGDLALLAG